MLFCVCHSKERSNVRIRNFLAANQQKKRKNCAFWRQIAAPVASATGAAMTPLCGVRGDVGIAPYGRTIGAFL